VFAEGTLTVPIIGARKSRSPCW